jgi:hypothetical protein
MKLMFDNKGVPIGIVLSRRNLLTLLHKLDMPHSARLIVREGFGVRAENDAKHYTDRDPGLMHPETEKFIAEHQKSK